MPERSEEVLRTQRVIRRILLNNFQSYIISDLAQLRGKREATRLELRQVWDPREADELNQLISWYDSLISFREHILRTSDELEERILQE